MNFCFISVALDVFKGTVAYTISLGMTPFERFAYSVIFEFEDLSGKHFTESV